MKLHDYQIEAIRSLWEFWKENPRGGSPLIVAPTGSGKSVIISDIIRRIISKKPEYKILIVSHRKEILEQNAHELQRLMPQEPIGIYSAGLGQKRFRRITYANIQSVFKADIPETQLVIVDECHLIPKNSDSMYQKFLGRVFAKNHNAKMVGLTATPYRLDQGSLISEDSLFTHVAYDIDLRSLIEQGFLSQLISRPSDTETDLSNVKTSGYDFNQGDLENAFDPMTEAHVEEVIAKGQNRKSWLIFCSSIKHAEHVSEVLSAKGVSSYPVHSQIFDMERDRRIREFKEGKVQAITNCDVLTTGFNHKPVDLLVLLRATKSCGLYVQMVGRGTRTAEGKKNCLVLDFGGNIERHGPIDLISVSVKKDKKAEIKKAPSKTCPACGCVVFIKVLRCPSCDHEFPLASTKLEIAPTSASILSQIEEREVLSWNGKIHRKEGKPPSLRLDYSLGSFTRISDFLCFEHGGFATHQAAKKWILRGGKAPVPQNTEEAFNRITELSEPDKVQVKKDGKYFRIVTMSFKERGPDAYEMFGINI